MANAAEEIDRGERFRFGENWRGFLATVDGRRVDEAERSLVEALGVASLSGKRFLDVGCGSGLLSLAAHRLGATVRSFDFDPASTECTSELASQWAPTASNWEVTTGSVLDADFMSRLGTHDVVYSWGVLHHTGDMDRALSNVTMPLAPKGLLYIALYNDQGWKSRFWLWVKQMYCRSRLGRAIVLALALPAFTAVAIVSGLRRSRRPWSRFTEYRRERGMSIYHDWIDWLGGLPFEYATVETVTRRFEQLGFETVRVVPTTGWGCNEFVFRSSAE